MAQYRVTAKKRNGQTGTAVAEPGGNGDTSAPADPPKAAVATAGPAAVGRFFRKKVSKKKAGRK